MLPLLAMVAVAGPFTEKSMLGPWPDRQIERGFALPKGWLQVGASADTKTSDAVRGWDGSRVPLAGEARWSYTRLWLRVDQGFSNNWRIYARIPWVRAHLRTFDGDAITTTALGDVHTGVWFEPWAPTHPITEEQRAAFLRPKWAVAAQVDLKAPSGVEWPGDTSGGPNDVSSFLTGTGITNLGVHVHAKAHTGPVGGRLAAGWVFKLPAIVGYVLQTDGFGNGKLDPGDELRVDAEGMLQLGSDVMLSVDGRFSWRTPTRAGAAGPGLGWYDPYQLQGVASYLDAGAAVSWEPGKNGELRAHVGYQLLGSDTTLWAPLGLEEFGPQPGLVVDVRGVVRW